MVFRVLVAVALLCGVARAQEPPWATGVTKETQQRAMKQYETANALFVTGDFQRALVEYDKALAIWQHPAIHYNRAMCLKNLDRVLDAYEALEKALAYGEAPLGKELFVEGTQLRAELGNKTALLVVTLITAEGKVMLDGTVLLDKPGTSTRRVLAGEHLLVAEKRDHETETRSFVLQGAETKTEVFELKRKQRGRTVRRWARWKPWVVVGAGAAVGLTGLLTVVSSKGLFDKYDRDVNEMCATEPGGGCTEGTPTRAKLDEQLSGAELRQNLGIGIVAAGGATFVIGLALVVLNQPRLAGATVTPNLSKEHAGATLSFAW